MSARGGDRIHLDAVGKRSPREGEVLEVVSSPSGEHYRVRWDDGHESYIRPAGGNARIIPKAAKKATR